MLFADQLESAPLGNVVATRVIDVEGRADKYVVEIGTPQQFEDDESWYCPYRITGPNREHRFAIVGIDSVQALWLALNVIGSELFVLNRDLGGKLRLLGEEELGFPVPASALDEQE
jgi:hypothetical protein